MAKAAKSKAKAAPAPAKAKAKDAKPAPAAARKPVTSALAAKSTVAKPAPASVKPKTGVTVKPKTGSTKADTDNYNVSNKPATAAFARAASAKPVCRKGPDGTVSPFTDAELKEWRATLLQKRSELSDDINDLRKDAMEAEDGNTTPNHIAERGSDADLQDMSLGVADQEEVLLWQIERALRKISIASPLPFGLCEHSRQPIARTRLQLIPWTPLSIEGATYMEENNLMVEDLLIDD